MCVYDEIDYAILIFSYTILEVTEKYVFKLHFADFCYYNLNMVVEILVDEPGEALDQQDDHH